MKYILYLILIVIGVDLIEKIIVWCREPLKRNEEKTSITKTKMPPKPIAKESGCALYNVEVRHLGRSYKALAEGKKVYYLDGNTKTYIGYYEPKGDGFEIKNKKGGVIGIVDKPTSTATISLSRLGVLEEYKKTLIKLKDDPKSGIPKEYIDKMYNDVVRNNKLIWLCAEAFDSAILDVDSYEVLASTKSKDLVANSAAFVCLHYEIIYGSNFNKFYSSINY